MRSGVCRWALTAACAGSRGVSVHALARPMMMSAAAAGQDLIEVEKKFQGISDVGVLETAVLRSGGAPLGSVSFTDTYYDTPDCCLTTRDIWLRQRDDNWELKVPIDLEARRSGGERTTFREVEGEWRVVSALAALDAKRFSPAQTMQDLLAQSGCASFASFETTRAKFALGRCTIDADVASFGHSVLEIEVMVREACDVAAAEADIAAAALQIGAVELTVTGGKLETYIRRFCPDVEYSLIAAGVLPPRAD
ncbi:CYTH-like domain-containing protein [Pelagophyceae sp. CCMP2097]|nr:CYTH-like domain-containing protein [Pelagophyceae sp. CCMP2097]|mmetsp:Transcript_11290/g.39766  ORF Transcript_11290/g.39766 Transcript_11290/m.39766 type:complete len:252 (-) Transcript_11290:9-764(-)